MGIYDEQINVALAMIKWGGGFVRCLGETLLRADRGNAQRIRDAFPDYWDEYLKKPKPEEGFIEYWDGYIKKLKESEGLKKCVSGQK